MDSSLSGTAVKIREGIGVSAGPAARFCILEWNLVKNQWSYRRLWDYFQSHVFVAEEATSQELRPEYCENICATFLDSLILTFEFERGQSIDQ